MSAGERRCLVIHPGALGDVLLALPALAHLARLLPGIHRVVAAAPRVAALLEGSAYAEETRDFDDLELHQLFMKDPEPRVLRALGEHDAIVSWFGAGDPTYRAHLAALGRPVVVARTTPSPPARRHAGRHLLDTLAGLGPVPDAMPAIRLAAPDAERVWAAAWLEARGLAMGEAVMLHPGAGSPAKAWPRFSALARRLEALGVPVIVAVGPADAMTATRLAADDVVPEAMIARDLPLRRLAGLLTTARAFVGNDSGPSHLAAAVACPSLVLFGPTDPAVWAPVGEQVTALAGAGVGAADPWDGLTVDRVEDALGGLLGVRPAFAG